MKELSIEQKAEAYDRVVNEIKNLRDMLLKEGVINKDGVICNNFNRIFPELAESEDERIRKALLEHIQLCTESIPDRDKFIAWLEKHGEQETDEWKEGNIIRHGGILALVVKGRRAMKSNGELFTVQYPKEWVKALPNEIEHFLNEFKKQGEQILANSAKTCKDGQKPAAWSEEDEKQARQIERIVHDDGCTQKLQKQIADWLKSIKERVQPKQEWSEEDEKVLDGVITNYESGYLPSVEKRDEIIEKLISLKDRYTWKPSDEQMEQLGWIAEQNKDNMIGKELMSLYQDLKKLREE